MIWQRVSGAGNSFFITDNLTQKKLSKDKRSELAKKLCLSYPNAKTDGLIVLDKHSALDFEWDFYNNDGSIAEMCGNAARCVSLYFQKYVKEKKHLSFLTIAGKIESEILSPSRVKVVMPQLSAQGKIKGHFYINSGVPHIVVEAQADRELAKNLRPFPLPRGSNITFVDGETAVTYERGVEDYTLACGTGAVAAAAYRFYKTGAKRSVVRMPGGELEVVIHDLASHAELVGDVRFDFIFETSDKITNN